MWCCCVRVGRSEQEEEKGREWGWEVERVGQNLKHSL